MRSNPRLFIRSLTSVLFSNNPFILLVIHLKKIIAIYCEFPRNSYNISQNISDNKIKFEKTKTIIQNSSSKFHNNSINLIR